MSEELENQFQMQWKARNITKCFIKYFNYPIILKNEYEARDHTRISFELLIELDNAVITYKL